MKIESMENRADGWRERSVLVTGGAGFMGSHLVEELVRRGSRVTVVDIAEECPPYLREIEEKVSYHRYDLNHAHNWEDVAPERFTSVFHLAGNGYVPDSVSRPNDDFDQNLKLFFLLLERLRRAKATATRTVLVSSAAVYGVPVKLPMEEIDPTFPISPYGVSKLSSENYARVYARIYGLQTVVGRVSSCYGPRQKKMVIYDLIRKILQTPDDLELFGDGSQKRDFIYVQDVVNALLHLSQKSSVAGEVFNIASGCSHSIAEIVGKICRELDVKPRIRYKGFSRVGDPDIWIISAEKLTGSGFQVEMTLEEGLRRTIQWIRSECR
jgi:UDP-glucose 4-epimerase